jgi:hypothetical protein
MTLDAVDVVAVAEAFAVADSVAEDSDAEALVAQDLELDLDVLDLDLDVLVVLALVVSELESVLFNKNVPLLVPRRGISIRLTNQSTPLPAKKMKI